MMEFSAVLTAFNEALIHSIWQIAGLAGLNWAAQKVVPKAFSKQRFWIAFLSLTLVPVLFIITFLSSTPSGETISQPIAAMSNNIASLLLPGFWCLSACYGITKLFMDWRGLNALRNADFQTPDDTLESRFAALLRKMDLKHDVELRLTQAVSSPCTFGLFKPIIFLPLNCLTRLSIVELEAILAHEIAHIKRYDYLFAWLKLIIRAAFYYHPGIHSLVRSIDREVEAACDSFATQSGVPSKNLALALLRLKISSQNQILLNAKPHNLRELEARISRLTGIRRETSRSLSRYVAPLLTLLVITVFGLVSLRFNNIDSSAPTFPFTHSVALTRTQIIALKDDVCDRLERDNIYGRAPYDSGGTVYLTTKNNQILMSNVPLPDATQAELKAILRGYGLGSHRRLELEYYRDHVQLKV